MEKRIYIYQVLVFKDATTTPTAEFRAVILSTDKDTAESDVRDAIIDDSDGEIGKFETKLLADFNEREVGLFDE
jgi:hypothetical protein